MASPVPNTFVHRENRDGTWDSICRVCYATVCTSPWEADLDRAEKAHVCDPALLAQWSRGERRMSTRAPKA